jgi:hypothetical protein
MSTKKEKPKYRKAHTSTRRAPMAAKATALQLANRDDAGKDQQTKLGISSEPNREREAALLAGAKDEPC